MANTTGFTATTIFSSEVINGADFCKHVNKKSAATKGAGFFYERDSFGYVFVEIVCGTCREKGLREIAESMVVCADCGKEHPQKETRQWRWYDFYAPQGDEPRIVCNTCWALPQHVDRMARDKADYDNEFPNDSFDDCDDDSQDDDDDIGAFFAEECAPEEEAPVVLLDIEFFRGQYFDNANRAPCLQNWSKCITGIKVVFN